MFLSQRPNTDPEPYLDKNEGTRWDRLAEFDPDCRFAPRPEFTQTRDPKPWLAEDENGEIGRAATEEDAWDQYGSEHGEMGEWFSFSPRHEEFDTPVSAILSLFRKELQNPSHPSIPTEAKLLATRWLQRLDYLSNPHEEIDHARRVLSKLVAVYGG